LLNLNDRGNPPSPKRAWPAKKPFPYLLDKLVVLGFKVLSVHIRYDSIGQGKDLQRNIIVNTWNLVSMGVK